MQPPVRSAWPLKCSQLSHHCCEGPGWETRLPPHGTTWGPLIWAFSAPRKSDIRMHTHTQVSEGFACLLQRSFRDLSLLIKLGPFPSYLAGGGGMACGSSSCRRTSHLPGLTDLHPPAWHQGPGTLTCRDGPAALHPGTLMIRSAGEERRACSFLPLEALPCRWFWIAGVKQKTENSLKDLQKHFRGEWLASIQDLTMVTRPPHPMRQSPRSPGQCAGGEGALP